MLPEETSVPAELAAGDVPAGELAQGELAQGELAQGELAGDEVAQGEVSQPAKVLRIGSMIKQLLEEVRHAPLDVASRARMKEIYDTSVHELASGLSPDLAAELDRLALPFETETPSEAELRVAQAQLVGWLEGLFHGIQATLFAQQIAAQAQLEEMRNRRLPAAGMTGQPEREPPRPGAYL